MTPRTPPNLCDVLRGDHGAEEDASHGLRQAHQCLQLPHCDAVGAVAAGRGVITTQPLEGAHQRGLGLRGWTGDVGLGGWVREQATCTALSDAREQGYTHGMSHS